MDKFQSLSHSKWECKYHVVFIPKCRRKTLYEELRPHLGEVFRHLAEHKGSRIEEGHLMPDHAHMLIAIPPKYAVSQVIGYIKGKSAIHLARVYGAIAPLPRDKFSGVLARKSLANAATLPFAPIVRCLPPAFASSRLRQAPSPMTLRQSYPCISPTAVALAPTSGNTHGIGYRGLTALASLSMAVSVGFGQLKMRIQGRVFNLLALALRINHTLYPYLAKNGQVGFYMWLR